MEGVGRWEPGKVGFDGFDLGRLLGDYFFMFWWMVTINKNQAHSTPTSPATISSWIPSSPKVIASVSDFSMCTTIIVQVRTPHPPSFPIASCIWTASSWSFFGGCRWITVGLRSLMVWSLVFLEGPNACWMRKVRLCWSWGWSWVRG